MLLPIIFSTPGGGGGGSFTVSNVLDGDSITTGSGPITDTIPAGAADATKEVFLVLVHARSTADTLTVTVGGSAPTATVISENNYSNGIINILRWDTPSGGNLALSISTSEAFRGVAYRAYTVINRGTLASNKANNSSYAALNLNTAVTNGAKIIGACMLGSNGTTGGYSYAGLTEVADYTSHNNNRDQYFFEATSNATETRTMTCTPTGDGTGQVAAALCVINP